MTADEVLRVHGETFYRSLIDQDYDALSDLYANEYMLVRSDGTVLDKAAVLRDLKLGGLTFKSQVYRTCRRGSSDLRRNCDRNR